MSDFRIVIFMIGPENNILLAPGASSGVTALATIMRAASAFPAVAPGAAILRSTTGRRNNAIL
ncbi:MAG: hypothetical protein R3E50_02085 [Halioglobus sp.]